MSNPKSVEGALESNMRKMAHQVCQEYCGGSATIEEIIYALSMEAALSAAPAPQRAYVDHVRVLPNQWLNIADAKPSSFEFATRDDAFRYCAEQLKNALNHAAAAPARDGVRELLAKWMVSHSFATGHGDTFADLLNSLSSQVAELRAAIEASTAEFEPLLRGELKHGRSCPATNFSFPVGDSADCNCGLQWRVRLQTEMTLRNAWEKRAYQAEAELNQARAAIEGESSGDEVKRFHLWWDSEGEQIASQNGKHHTAIMAWKARAERVLEAAPREIGDYSCAVCGFGMKEPCEHWKEFRTNQEAAPAAAPLPTAREGLEAMLTRYEALPGDDNLSVEFVRQDLRAVKAGTYDPHRR